MEAVLNRIRQFIMSREWPPASGESWNLVVRSALTMLVSVVCLVSGLARLEWWFIAAFPLFGIGLLCWPASERSDSSSSAGNDALETGS